MTGRGRSMTSVHQPIAATRSSDHRRLPSSVFRRPAPILRLFFALVLIVTTGPGPRARAEREQLAPGVGLALAGALTGGQEGVQEFTADQFGLPLADDAVARQYAGPSVLLVEGERILLTVTVPADGAYTLAVDMVAVDAFMNQPEVAVHVDGAIPLAEARRILLPVFYTNSRPEFPLDRYGNQALIRQNRLLRWSRVDLRDANFSLPRPLALPLTTGTHTLEVEVTQGSFYLGSLYLQPAVDLPAYAPAQAPEPAGVLIAQEAELPAFKNDAAIRPVADRALTVSPYDTYRLLLNVLGGDSWRRSGGAVYYTVTVPSDGLYLLTLRARQNTRGDFTVFRRITVNGQVPFAELNAVAFPRLAEWTDVTLGGPTPYRLFLRAGENVIGFEATDAPYAPVVARIQQALLDINTLSLEVKKLTGNQVDPFKEWQLSAYIPDLEQRLLALAEQLRADRDLLLALNPTGGSAEVQMYQMAIDNIAFLAAEPDELPNRLNRFSEGSGSAAQLLGRILPLLQQQPLMLDQIFIHSVDRYPEPPRAPFWLTVTENARRFWRSFQPDPYQSIGAAEGELEVWVNRPRQYVDLLQQIADERFTPETGIPVKFSIMPDENKLVLANAAGIQPDVALGVSTNIPYELAIRNALIDLRQFDDFNRTIGVFAPGSLLSYIINDSVYALPETQDFWVTVYRRDILESLGLPVPQTWDEVIQILPELQRFGMNYNTPLSSGPGVKQYLFTAPYLFNAGAELYSADGFSTALGSDAAVEGLTFMAESFTLYGMPLTTASFYDSFRYGSLPVGVTNFTTYLQLTTAAPEIAGLWSIDLYPATVLDDGRELRYATGSAQASLVFANTEQPEAAWTFLQWWVSTETQTDFQHQLLMNYGPEYLWISANLEVLEFTPIPREHREVIREQWRWLQEPVKLPGSYMQEREISNAWNRMVFDGVNPRVAIDDAAILINREIARKMEEFGYLRDGVVVRAFSIPTLDTVREWQLQGAEVVP